MTNPSQLNDFSVMREMGVSSALILQRDGDNLLIAVVKTDIPDTPLFLFTLNQVAQNNVETLDAGKQYVLPGMNIKELSQMAQTGIAPDWIAKL